MQENKEKEMCDKIIKSVNTEPVPDSLKPKNIEKMLEQHKTSPAKMGRWAGILAAAAVAAVAVSLGGWMLQRGSVDSKPQKEILLADSEEETETLKKDQEDKKTAHTIEGMKMAEDYEEIRNLLNQNQTRRKEWYSDKYDDAKFESSSDLGIIHVEESNGLGAGSSSAEDNAAGSSFSKLNIREEGVMEADILLTDGEYIYTVDDTHEKIAIVKVDQQTGAMQQVSTIRTGYIKEMYLENNYLIVINTIQVDDFAQMLVYDITDRTKPTEAGSVMMDGEYIQSRMVDGYIYLFSSYQKEYSTEDLKEEDGQSGIMPCYIPRVWEDSTEKVLDSAEIYIRDCAPDHRRPYGYIIGISVALTNPGTVADRLAILTYVDQFYASKNNFYITFTAVDSEENTMTNISKVSYQDGKIEPAGTGSVEGRLNDSFSIDEYEGMLRLVATRQNYSQEEVVNDNCLYVLDGQLNMVGRIEDLAKGERIYSARFMGNVGYFVTYRQVDPLFSVDLSNPAEPKILGELKIPGFSEYLHPYGENRLLGIGWDTTYYADQDWLVTNGMKLSMFDTSDPGNVTEQHKKVFQEVSRTSATYNYKAILVDAEKNLFGFAVEKTMGRTITSYFQTYCYDENQGFQLVTETQLGGYGIEDVRGVYIGDILYIKNDAGLKAVDIHNDRIVGKLELEE